jgi:hypothetical protein
LVETRCYSAPVAVRELLVASLSLSAAACDAPRVEVERTPDLSRVEVRGIDAIDGRRAVATFERAGGTQGFVAMIGAAGAAWAVAPPCDATRAPVALVAASDLVVARCKRGDRDALQTIALDGSTGALRWASEKKSIHQGDRLVWIEVDRRGDTLLERDEQRDVVARDVRDGHVRWRADPVARIKDIGARHVVLDERGDRIVARRIADGRELAAAQGYWLGAAADRFFVKAGNDVLGVPLDGGAAMRVASPAPPPAGGDHIEACAARGADFVLLFGFHSHHGGVFARVHEGAVTGTVRVDELDFPVNRAGWSQPLPRYLPLRDWEKRALIVLDLDEMRVKTRVSFPPRGPTDALGDYEIHARLADRFLMHHGDRVFAFDADLGAFVASDQRYSPRFYWTDMQFAKAGGALWRAPATGPIEPVALDGDSALARALNAGAVP